MHRLSMVQALSIWSDLEAALRGESGFGGHVTEIYVYRLQPNCPTASHPSQMGQSARMLEAKQANAAFYSLLQHFAHTREARIDIAQPKMERKLGPWLTESTNDHRWHVRVRPIHEDCCSRC